jgi:hypothetical protein
MCVVDLKSNSLKLSTYLVTYSVNESSMENAVLSHDKISQLKRLGVADNLGNELSENSGSNRGGSWFR